MSTIRSPVDQYGFERPEDFDYDGYEKFMSNYLTVLARRAARWNSILKGSPKVKKSRRVKRFVRKGIPSDSRAQVWMDVSKARKMKKENPGKYGELLTGTLDEVLAHVIRMDINRTFPENIHFGNSRENLKNAMHNVLVAYAHYNPAIGYCQGLNYITGLILLILKDEESTFWLLEALLRKRVPDYHAKDMVGLQAEQEVLSELVKERMPDLHAHIEEIGLSYSIFSTKWFICLYIDVLPIETVLRIWDCLFYEGSKILLRVALTLLSLNKDKLMNCTDFASLCAALKEITIVPSTTDCHQFMQNCFVLPGSLPMRRIHLLRKEARERVQARSRERK